MRSRLNRQRDLFEAERKAWDIPSTQKTLLVSLIERLLVEALVDQGPKIGAFSETTTEADHEQDLA